MVGSKLYQLATVFFCSKSIKFKKIKPDGSKRIHWIISYKDQKIIGTEFEDINRNKKFIEFTNYFKRLNFPVGEIYLIAEDNSCYLCKYLGKYTLANHLSNLKDTNEIFKVYNQIFPWIDNFFIKGSNFLQENYPNQLFDKRQIINDFEYFQKELIIDYQLESILPKNFLQLKNKLINKINNIKPRGFIYRDFQVRNIIWQLDKPYFIDYQDALFGPDGYDLVSLLFSGAGHLNFKNKLILLDKFIIKYRNKNENEFLNNFFYLALIRKLHSLATYIKLGIKGRNQRFIGSSKKIINEIIELINYKKFLQEYEGIIEFLIEAKKFLIKIDK